mgnify:CR=1 FL=1
MKHTPALAFSIALALLSPTLASAQSAVALAGILGGKALLVVNGGAPRGVGAGESHQGVKVLSVGKEEAVVEIDGTRRSLRLGEAPVSVGSGAPSGDGADQRLEIVGCHRGRCYRRIRKRPPFPVASFVLPIGRERLIRPSCPPRRCDRPCRPGRRRRRGGWPASGCR